MYYIDNIHMYIHPVRLLFNTSVDDSYAYIIIIIEEVRVKSKVLERVQGKLRSAEEEIKDLSSEFEFERQDLLDAIRTQQRQLQLQEQLLHTVVPCLRRDCNYYNIDNIRTECVWDGEASCWILPKLTVKKSSLLPVDSKQSLLDLQNTPSQPLKQLSGGGGPSFGTNDHLSAKNAKISTSYVSHSPSHSSSLMNGGGSGEEEDRYLLRLQHSGEPDYFKPKRAAELLARSSQLKESDHVEGGGVGWLNRSGSLTTTLPSAATVHGVDSITAGDSPFSKRPGRLQSLPVSPSLPHHFGSLPLPPDPGKANIHMLEKVEKRISSRKRNSLEPLQEIGKPRRPPL